MLWTSIQTKMSLILKKSQDTAENLKQNLAIGSILTSVVSSTRTLFEHNLIFRPTNNIDFWKYMLIPGH